MKQSIREKLENLCDRHEEVGALLSDPQIIGDQNRFRELSQEYAEIEPVVETFNHYLQQLNDMSEAQEMLSSDDSDMVEMAKEEVAELKSAIESSESKLETLMLPKDPNDDKNVFLEVRAGTGGDEAAIFSGDLYRMYSRYAESRGWKVEVISEREGEHGGFKEIITRIVGSGAYSALKFESGAHRVQRVPETESQGRIHTSACTVAVMAEADEMDAIDINKADLRVDTFRASGAGGQHVNKTDSAIRITHLPTGVVVECQDERSQHKNRAKAMALLASRLRDSAESARATEQAEVRRNLVGSGDRSERIRTYNYPQGRITDHRINLTLYKLDEVMQGDLGVVVGPLLQEYQADLLASLAEGE